MSKTFKNLTIQGIRELLITKIDFFNAWGPERQIQIFCSLLIQNALNLNCMRKGYIIAVCTLYLEVQDNSYVTSGPY